MLAELRRTIREKSADRRVVANKSRRRGEVGNQAQTRCRRQSRASSQ